MSYGLESLDCTTGLQTMKHQRIHFRHVNRFNLYCNLRQYCFYLCGLFVPLVFAT
jgi:hypothetical protein